MPYPAATRAARTTDRVSGAAAAASGSHKKIPKYATTIHSRSQPTDAASGCPLATDDSAKIPAANRSTPSSGVRPMIDSPMRGDSRARIPSVAIPNSIPVVDRGIDHALRRRQAFATLSRPRRSYQFLCWRGQLGKSRGVAPPRQRGAGRGSRRPVAERAVRADVVVLLPPPLREDLRLRQRVENLAVKEVIAELAVEGLDVP